ncbi:hypothetical protein [Pelagibacterium lacus]|uniref:Copper-binding protein n=1 Tax=Pelagibacterium lacus TaxID=2282655 RepID=A0A369W590_9HYPH|nr:hypothetical protein [Pelagibacterium lacus]RDE09189.1 hypothetical protein DVH29_06895 [Pelagibacterium lacus]
MRNWLVAACAAGMVLGSVASVQAEGNLASQPERLELSIDSRDLSFSNTEFQLETGKYYIWEITHDGLEEVMIQAPDLFRNSWINQVVINDLEVHTSGAIYGVEFDDEGTLAISFVPIRPGNYQFFAPGFQDRGLSGTFVVR